MDAQEVVVLLVQERVDMLVQVLVTVLVLVPIVTLIKKLANIALIYKKEKETFYA